MTPKTFCWTSWRCFLSRMMFRKAWAWRFSFTLIARGAFGVGPAYVVDAPEYGAARLSWPANWAHSAGNRLSLIPCGAEKGEEELTKRFETALMTEASGMLLLDDVPHGQNAKLSDNAHIFERDHARAKNSESSARMMSIRAVRTDATTLVVTGCAVEVGKDMVRRVLRSNLDPRKAADRVSWEAEACRLDLDAMYS